MQVYSPRTSATSHLQQPNPPAHHRRRRQPSPRPARPPLRHPLHTGPRPRLRHPLTVPTINLAPYTELLPANGVYITSLRIGVRPGASSQKPSKPSPTQATVPPLAQTRSPSSPIYSTFTHRPERTNTPNLDLPPPPPPRICWPNTEALREQIGRDVAKAKRYFHLCRTLTTDKR